MLRDLSHGRGPRARSGWGRLLGRRGCRNAAGHDGRALGGSGTKLNLERSLRLGDELGGHLVTGHVDGIAELLARDELPEMARLSLRAPAALARFIAPKGSVALDGVSLTVNEVDDDRFSVLIIPHTLKVTTFGALRAGARLNLEVDLMARYAARLLQAPQSNASR